MLDEVLESINKDNLCAFCDHSASYNAAMFSMINASPHLQLSLNISLYKLYLDSTASGNRLLSGTLIPCTAW